MNCCRSARINYVQEPSISLEVKETERQGGGKYRAQAVMEGVGGLERENLAREVFGLMPNC